MGRAQCPSQSSSPEHRTSFLRVSTETTTKPSRRWQPPRVTSTIGLQDDHLVPLDVTSRCNRTRIAHSLNRMNTIKQESVRGLPSTLKHGHKVLEVLSTSHGRDHLLFIAPWIKIAVTPSIGVFWDDRTRRSYRPHTPYQRPISMVKLRPDATQCMTGHRTPASSHFQ